MSGQAQGKDSENADPARALRSARQCHGRLLWSAFLFRAETLQHWAPQGDSRQEEMQASLASGVGLHVDSQVVVPVEGSVTLGALIWTLTSVDTLVTKEVRRPAEGLATVGTGRPALPVACVLTLVKYQGLSSLEGAQAFTTVVYLSC